MCIRDRYNVKQYALNLLNTYMKQSITGTLVAPSPQVSFYSYYDSASASNYDEKSVREFINGSLDIISGSIMCLSGY